MTQRYGPLTLQIKQLSNLNNIGSAYTNIITADGTQKKSEGGNGRFVIPRNYALISAIESNIGQVAYVYITDQVAGGAQMDVATFIIKSVDKTTDPNGVTVTVSGQDLTDQLTYNDLADNTVDDGSGNKDTDDVDTIMDYAPSGWAYTINGGAGTGSSNGTYFTSRGNNVLELLRAAAAQNSGDFFRLSSYSPPAKTIDWRTSADSSSVTLRMPSNPMDYDGSTTTGIIYNMTEDASFEEVVTRVRPYGAGVGDGRLDITGISGANTGGDPTGYTTTFSSNVIVNTALEASLGYQISRDVDFSRNQAADTTNATQLTSAAVALWNEAITYLQERDSSKKFYKLSCNVAADLRPGQTVTINYTEYEGGITGGSAVWSVSGSFTIHEVKNSVPNSGNLAGTRITELTVANTPAPKATGARMLANAVSTMRETTRKTAVSTSPGSVSTGRTINATQPVRIDGGASADLSANRTLSINGLSTVGSANQVPGTNAAGTAWEYKTVTGGTGISIGHSAGAITITNSSPGSSLAGLAYVTIGNTGSLSAERALTAGDGLDLTDGGANSTVTLAVDVTDILGNGLTETSNNITLGTPSTITGATTNSVTASSHTHAITLNHSDLGSIGANDHHNRSHSITSASDHTVTGAALDVVGLTATNTLGILTPSAAVSTAASVVLKSDSNGRLRLQGLGISATAGDNAVTMGDNTWIGLGSAAGRVVFDNQTIDQIEIRDASVIFNSNTLDPNVPATTDRVLHMIDADIVLSNSDIATGAIFAAHAYGTGIPGSPRFIGRSARGTRSSPTATQSGDTLAKFGGAGYDGTNFSSAARAHISIVAGSTYTPTAQGARILFYTTQGTGTTEALCMSLEGNGDLVKYNATESLKIVDAGSAGASSAGTVTDWIQVQVGVTTGYIKVYNSK